MTLHDDIARAIETGWDDVNSDPFGRAAQDARRALANSEAAVDTAEKALADIFYAPPAYIGQYLDAKYCARAVLASLGEK